MTQVVNQDNYHNYLMAKTALEQRVKEPMGYHWIFSEIV